MEAQAYSIIKSSCSGPLRYAPVLKNISLIEQLDIVNYARKNLPERYRNKLPDFFRNFFIALKTLKEADADEFLAAWKKQLSSEILGLSEDNISYFYVILFVMCFIKFYAFNEYDTLYYSMYAQILSLCSII